MSPDTLKTIFLRGIYQVQPTLYQFGEIAVPVRPTKRDPLQSCKDDSLV